jgi:hypothetical protein
MIKVYVFVTGLVLYQFSPNAGGTHHAMLAAGDYQFPQLARIATHEVKVFSGQAADPVTTVPIPLVADLSVPCNGCAAVTVPAEIASLDELMGVDGLDPAAKSGCLTAATQGSCPSPAASRASNGVLTFKGGWSV